MKDLREEMGHYKRAENKIILIFYNEVLHILHLCASWLASIILIFVVY